MAGSIGYLEAMNALNSSQNAAGSIEAGAKKVKAQQAQQQDLQKQIDDMKAQLQDLEKQADDINNKSGFEKFMGGLFGGDCGAGDVSNKTKQVSSDLKKQSEELKVAQAKIEMMLNAITGTQQDLSQRTTDSQKTHDDTDNAAAMSQS
jgi:hypothetical protein